MKNLRIGDRVVVKAIARMTYAYVEGGPSRIVDRCSCRLFDAVIVGQRRKFVGKYVSYKTGLHPDYEEPAYLKRTGSEILWAVRRKLLGPEILVHDDDIELAHGKPDDHC